MEQSHHIRSVTLFISALAVILFLYYPTALSILRVWLDSEAYSHGFLLLPICMILIYIQWKRTGANISLKPSLSVLFLIILISLGWALAKIGYVQIVQQLALISLYILTPVALYGYKAGRRLIIPIALLLLAIPIWDILLIYLQTVTVVMVNLLLNIFGISAIREGLIIQVPSGIFEVAESCSGLRQFIVATIIGILFVFRYQLRIKESIIFVLLTMLLAIVVNIIRVFVVTVVGEYTNMQHSLIHDHAMLGWSIFGIAVFIWIYFSTKYVQNHNAISRTVFINTDNNCQKELNIPNPGWKILLIILAYSTGPLFYLYLTTHENIALNAEIKLPEQIDSFTRQEFIERNWQPLIHGEDDKILATYKNEDGSKIDVLIYRYSQQEQGKEAIHVENRLYNPLIWKIQDQEKILLSTSSSRNFQVEVTKIKTLSGNERLIFRWYRTFNKDIASPLYAKGINIIGSILGDPSISIVIVSVEMTREPVILNQQLNMFTKKLKTSLDDAGL
jgi:EpsI family protein